MEYILIGVALLVVLMAVQTCTLVCANVGNVRVSNLNAAVTEACHLLQDYKEGK